MSRQKAEEMMSVRIVPNTTSNPPGKLADAEVIFEAEAGPLTGLKLIGFAVWERRAGGRNVTFPARQYSVNGERRSFALLRPANGGRRSARGDSGRHPRRVQPRRGRHYVARIICGPNRIAKFPCCLRACLSLAVVHLRPSKLIVRSESTVLEAV
jgi:hypothetical protein